MSHIEKIIGYARENKCSDIHLTYELNPVFRKNGSIFVSDLEFTKNEIQDVIKNMLDEGQTKTINRKIDVDFCHVTQDGKRQRVNVYHQKGKLCAAIRILNDQIPTLDELKLPPVLEKLCNMPNGLILITGPTGSGKSTTLAAMIDYINRHKKSHILTLEDPIEYLHEHKKSIIHQREVGRDIDDFGIALKSALREDPDVILVGEMRDLETISAAVTAAETGHLVLSTLHTTGAANTIDRIIDVFDSGSQDQIRTQLASVLRGVVTQTLIPLADHSGRCGAFEILIANDAVCNLIRENRCHQIGSILQTGAKDGMCSLNSYLANLVNENKITLEQAMEKAIDRTELARYIK